jgi:hypothetical protein
MGEGEERKITGIRMVDYSQSYALSVHLETAKFSPTIGALRRALPSPNSLSPYLGGEAAMA